MTDTEATASADNTEAAASADKPKRELTPEQEVNRVLYRAVARALAKLDPGEGDLKARWSTDRTKYINEARKLAKALRKERVTLTVAPKAESEADPED